MLLNPTVTQWFSAKMDLAEIIDGNKFADQ